MKYKMTSDQNYNQFILQKLKANEGYCPCVIDSRGKEEYKCPCENFRNEIEVGETCHCGLYVKTKK